MRMIKSFDPAAASAGDFDPQVANPCGGVYLFNESDNWLALTLPDGGIVGLPAWWARFYHLNAVNANIKWQTLATIVSIARPLSQVYGESYERNEIVGRSFYDGPIPRNPFIANSVSSSVSTNQVINDGNLLMQVLEATLQGNTGGSNSVINNDGSFYFAQWVSSAYEKYFQGIPGANPVLELGAKLIIQALDNSGANLSNILGIDSSGNTFLQNHKTNKQTVIYSSTGVALITVDDNGNISHGTRFITPFHLTTNPTVNSGVTTTLTCTGGSTGVPTGASGVIIGGGISSGTAGAYIQVAPHGATLGQYGGFTCQNAGSQLEEFVMTVPISAGGQLDVHANSGNIVLQDWYITGYII